MLIVLMFLPLLYIFAVTLFNALTAPLLRRAPRPRGAPRVSVLVPVRNEEINLRACLESLCAQEWSDLEILVLDDDSIDDTWAIIEEMQRKDPRVRGFRGAELPADWLGKPWACQQLSYEATGEILIFTDADNRHSPEAIRNTVGWIQAKRLNLLSALPQQIARTPAEQLLVPTVDMLAYSLLPLRLSLSLPQPSLSAASGHWLAMTRGAYDQTGGHRAVRNEVVEDMALIRRAKAVGMRTLTLAGTGIVFTKTHGDFQEVWLEYKKNIYGFAGKSPARLAGQISFLAAATLLPYLLLLKRSTRGPATQAVFLNLAVRAVMAAKYRHPWLPVLLHPVAMLLLFAIALSSLNPGRTGMIRWKGRTIRLADSGAQTLK